MIHIEKQTNSENKFHWLFMPNAISTAALYDSIIEETQNFAVLPTRGSIVSGWVLVVPKFPMSRMADVPIEMRGELDDLVARIFNRLSINFGKPYIFEHGGFKGSSVSCGVDQAHLHIVPLTFDLVLAAKSEASGDWISVDTGQLPYLDFIDEEYWFVSSGNISMYKKIDCPCSQFFRRIIARESGKEQFWDYRSEDFLDNVASTIEVMGNDE